MDGGEDDPNNDPKVPPNCACGYGPLKSYEWCPRCWPNKKHKKNQLNLFEES